MREISLNVLDIVQNSVVAGAGLIEISVGQDTENDRLTVFVGDDGRGMTPEQLEQVRDPFYTTRATRKVGLGVSFFRMAAELSGGSLDIDSAPGVGTKLEAVFGLSHIDRMPLGDMCSTIVTLIQGNPAIDFVYRYSVDGKVFTLDTRELREVLEDVPLNTPDVLTWIGENIVQGVEEVEQG